MELMKIEADANVYSKNSETIKKKQGRPKGSKNKIKTKSTKINSSQRKGSSKKKQIIDIASDGEDVVTKIIYARELRFTKEELEQQTPLFVYGNDYYVNPKYKMVFGKMLDDINIRVPIYIRDNENAIECCKNESIKYLTDKEPYLLWYSHDSLYELIVRDMIGNDCNSFFYMYASLLIRFLVKYHIKTGKLCTFKCFSETLFDIKGHIKLAKRIKGDEQFEMTVHYLEDIIKYNEELIANCAYYMEMMSAGYTNL